MNEQSLEYMLTGKYYVKDSMQEVEFGSIVQIDNSYTKDDILYIRKEQFTLKLSNVNLLIAKGYIIKDKNFVYFFNKVREKLGIEVKKDAVKLFESMDELTPSAVFSLLAKEISREFENIYGKNTPFSSNYIYVINTLDGNINEISISRVKNLHMIAYFRNREDAEKAKEILNPILKSIYDKQED